MNKLLKYIHFSYNQPSSDVLINQMSKYIPTTNHSDNKPLCSKPVEKNETEASKHLHEDDADINLKEISNILKIIRLLKLIEHQEEVHGTNKTDDQNVNKNEAVDENSINLIEYVETLENEINEQIEYIVKNIAEFKHKIRHEFSKNTNSGNLNLFKSKLSQIKSSLNVSIEIMKSVELEQMAQVEVTPAKQANNDNDGVKLSNIKFELGDDENEKDEASVSKSSSKSPISLKHILNIKNALFTDLRYICDFESNKHIVISDGYPGQCLRIYDRESYNYVKSVNLDGRMGRITGVCAINDEKQLCVVDWSNTCLYILDHNYELVKLKILSILKYNKKRWYEAIDYNQANQKLYLISRESCSVLIFNKELQQLNDVQLYNGPALFECIRIYNQNIYICDSENKCVHVFDTDLNKVTKFGNFIIDCPTDILIAKPEQASNNKMFLCIMEFGRKEIKIFNLVDYEFITKISISTPFSCSGLILNNRIIINSDSKELHVYEIQSVKHNNSLLN